MGALRGARSSAAGEAGPGAVNAEIGGAIRGTVRVAPAVLFGLIELAVREVPGVVGLAAPRGVERILPSGGGSVGTGVSRGVPVDAAETDGAVYESAGIRVRPRREQLDADVADIAAASGGERYPWR